MAGAEIERLIQLLAKLPGHIRVRHSDDVSEKYLLLSNSHDGSSALRVYFTSIRVVCANTLAMADRQGRGEGIAIRHQGNLVAKIRQAREVHKTGGPTMKVHALLASAVLLASPAVFAQNNLCQTNLQEIDDNMATNTATLGEPAKSKVEEYVKQARQAHAQGHGNQPRQEPGHAVAGRRTSAPDFGAGLRLSESTRSELTTTRMDDVDIATAATRGVT